MLPPSLMLFSKATSPQVVLWENCRAECPWQKSRCKGRKKMTVNCNYKEFTSSLANHRCVYGWHKHDMDNSHHQLLANLMLLFLTTPPVATLKKAMESSPVFSALYHDKTQCDVSSQKIAEYRFLLSKHHQQQSYEDKLHLYLIALQYSTSSSQLSHCGSADRGAGRAMDHHLVNLVK